MSSIAVPVILLWFLSGARGQQQGFRVCKDDYQDCGMWLKSGMCQKPEFRQFITNGCARTCGLCTDEMLLKPQEGLQSADWSKSNHQTRRKPVGRKFHHPRQHKVKPQLLSEQYRLQPQGRNPLPENAKFLLPQLKHKAFGLTFRPNMGFPNILFIWHKKADNSTGNATTGNTTSTAVPENCTDIFLKCPKWKEEKLCQEFELREYLKYGCAKTCRFCNCRDTSREAPYCPDWKKKDFCKIYPNQMDNYCPKTCLLCGDSLPPPGQNATSSGTNTSRIALSGANKIHMHRHSHSLQGMQSFKAKKPLLFPHKKQQHRPLEFPGTKIVRPSLIRRPFKGNKKPSFSIMDISKKRSEPINRKPRSSQTSRRDQEEHFDISNSNTDSKTPPDFQDFEGNSASSLAGKSHSGELEGIPIIDESNKVHRVGTLTAHVRENSKGQEVMYGSKTYLTPVRKRPEQTEDETDIYIENYSKDPDVAASQKMDQMQVMAQTGETFAYSRSRFHSSKDLPNHQLQAKPDQAAENRDQTKPHKKTGHLSISNNNN